MMEARARARAQELIRAREEDLKCVDVVVALVDVVVALVDAVDALTEEVVVEVSGCLFVVTVMSSMIRVGMHVAVDVARSILNAQLVRIRSPNLLHLHLHLHPYPLPHQLPQTRNPVVLVMYQQPLASLQRRHLVRLSPQFK
jgi:hypothetical protein